jgi:hypothetical protein
MKGIYALALKLSPAWHPTYIIHPQVQAPELASILFCFFIFRGQTSLLVLISKGIHCLAFNY